MKKEILSEINRNREIMGLSLISEAYEVRAEGTIKDSAEYINKYLMKKGFKGGINTKTLISLCLASCLVLIQIFWK